jgi:uncharacterized protein (DUF1501 family)
MLATGGGFASLPLSALPPTPDRKRTLVCIFQRGAMDGIAAVQPLADPNLQQLRPALTLAAGSDKDQLLDLDGRFGLHPSLRPLGRLYGEGRLRIIHGVGLPNPVRSHFDAQDYVETATPGRKSTPDGWLNRAAAQLPGEGTPLRMVSLTPALPRALYGEQYAVAVEQLSDLGVRGGSSGAGGGFEALYRQASQEVLRNAGTTGLDAANLLSAAALENYRPARGVRYPNSPLGRGLRQIAQLIKSDVGLEIAFAESPNWDTHARQGGRFGRFTQQANDLAGSVTNFWRDLGGLSDRVTLMTITEFGRTVHQNGSGGTDHGRASCAFVIDDGFSDSRILGEVPALLPANLEDGRDLPVTTDFRSYFAAVSAQRLGATNTAALFPGWTGAALPGLF